MPQVFLTAQISLFVLIMMVMVPAAAASSLKLGSRTTDSPSCIMQRQALDSMSSIVFCAQPRCKKQYTCSEGMHRIGLYTPAVAR